MKEKSQKIYEKLCFTLKDIDIENGYYLAIMGMSRTLCLCSKINKFDFLRNILIIRKFMENNLKDIFYHKQTYSGYDEVYQLFDELSDNWEDCLSNYHENTEDIALTSGLCDFMEAWYAFLGVISTSYENFSLEKMVFFITLPIRYLNDYLTNYYNSIDENKLQSFVNDHKAIENEVNRIYSDIQLVLNNSEQTIISTISFYCKLDILKW